MVVLIVLKFFAAIFRCGLIGRNSNTSKIQSNNCRFAMSMTAQPLVNIEENGLVCYNAIISRMVRLC
ncbi:hypothetical protein [Neorhizobium galegae]|uniref:hypothetical protein n=1 Tax=Neorhizobium galegae TaxID=399 RepID=UPI001F1AF783|nr:hypothetical protein [Neorhizobium galegae]UIK04812.1 hypothetical protein LZK81_19445 [Neorhizobium galegae]